jgi:undecaprenyl-diphosphatase
VTLRARLTALDLATYRRIRMLARQPSRVRWIRHFSALGEYGSLWLAIGVAGLLLDRRRARRWARGAAAVGFAHACSSAVKAVVRRERPAVEDLPHLMATPTGLSFPSSHSASAFAAARAYGGLMPSPPLYALAALMALSRVHLGVHYPSDVAAGAALGIVAGSAGR